ncbi:MAG: hypothetical protein DRJ15_12990 [Bacteroidetes bacterium]|nr:MAG: hypothetical protein DRJ15_12990 [Bacteroidota bacterium]
MSQRVIETIGHVEKKENLQSLGYSKLVLESEHPFPGYHGTTVPDQDMPKSLFLLTKTKYTDEFIIRSVKSVKKKHKFSFDGSPAKVYFKNSMVQSIRIKDLDSYEKIPDILKALKEEGIAFLPGKKVKPYYGLIRVTKYFLLNPITDCTLQDDEVQSMKYFQIPVKLDWDEFEEMTIHVKRNIDNINWDGALATIYRKTGIEDYIRIYHGKNCDIEALNLIRKKYVQEIKKVMGK